MQITQLNWNTLLLRRHRMDDEHKQVLAIVGGYWNYEEFRCEWENARRKSNSTNWTWFPPFVFLSRLPFYFLPNQMRLCWARHHHHITRRTRCLVNWSKEKLLRCAQFPLSTFLIRKRNDRDIHLGCESFVIHCKHTHVDVHVFRSVDTVQGELKRNSLQNGNGNHFVSPSIGARNSKQKLNACKTMWQFIFVLAMFRLLFDRRPIRRQDSSFSSDFKLLHFYFHSRLFIQVIVIIFVMQPTEKPIESPTERKQNARNTIHIEIEHGLASDFLVVHTTHSSLRRIIKSKVMSMWI